MTVADTIVLLLVALALAAVVIGFVRMKRRDDAERAAQYERDERRIRLASEPPLRSYHSTGRSMDLAVRHSTAWRYPLLDAGPRTFTADFLAKYGAASRRVILDLDTGERRQMTDQEVIDHRLSRATRLDGGPYVRA